MFKLLLPHPFYWLVKMCIVTQLTFEVLYLIQLKIHSSLEQFANLALLCKSHFSHSEILEIYA